MTDLCAICHLPGPHSSGHQCAGAAAEAILTLLRNIGDLSACRGCGAEIYWVRHKNGKATPYDPTGLNHFISCPKAAQFHRSSKAC